MITNPSAGALAAVEELDSNAYLVRPTEISQEKVKRAVALIIDQHMRVIQVETDTAMEWIERWVDTKMGKGNRACGWPNFGSIRLPQVAEMVASLLAKKETGR